MNTFDTATRPQPLSGLGGAELRPVRCASFWIRLFRRGKAYLLPLVLIDATIVFAFSLHLSFLDAARLAVQAYDRVHVGDPRGSALLADAQVLLWKSILTLGASVAAALVSIIAVVLLCWSARCHRRRKRMATEIGAAVLGESAQTPVTIVDLSADGCKVKPASALEGVSPVRLAIAGRTEVTARVVWIRDGLAGLVFLAPPEPPPPSK